MNAIHVLPVPHTVGADIMKSYIFRNNNVCIELSFAILIKPYLPISSHFQGGANSRENFLFIAGRGRGANSSVAHRKESTPPLAWTRMLCDSRITGWEQGGPGFGKNGLVADGGWLTPTDYMPFTRGQFQ